MAKNERNVRKKSPTSAWRSGLRASFFQRLAQIADQIPQLMLCFSEIGLILPKNRADLFGAAGRAPSVNQKREQLLGLAPLKQKRSAL